MWYFLDMCKVLWRHREGKMNYARAHRRAHSVFEIDATSRHQRLKKSLSCRRKESLLQRGDSVSKVIWNGKEYFSVFLFTEDSTGKGKSQEMKLEREGVWSPPGLPYIPTLSHCRVNEEFCLHFTQLSSWSFLATHSLHQFYLFTSDLSHLFLCFFSSTLPIWC